MTNPLRDGIGRVDGHSAANGRQYNLNSGMLVSAEIHLGTRTVMKYLLSPVSKTLHEAGREL